MAENAKQALIDALNSTVPGIDDFIGTPIPELEEITSTFDADNPTQNNEILAYNVNKILKTFEGLIPVELILRIGQKNETIQAMLLAGLEYIGAGEASMTVVAPVASGEYYGWFDSWIVNVTGGMVTSVSVTVDGETFPLLDDGETNYLGLWPIAVGTHTATIKAVFEDNTSKIETISFEVKHCEDIVTIPTDDTYTTLTTITANTELLTEDLTSVECAYSDGGANEGVWSLVKSASLWTAEGVTQIAAGTYNAVFEFTRKTGEVAKKAVSFIIS